MRNATTFYRLFTQRTLDKVPKNLGKSSFWHARPQQLLQNTTSFLIACKCLQLQYSTFFSPKSSSLSERTLFAFITGQTSPQCRIYYSQRASWTTSSCVRRLVRPNLLWRRQRQHRWQWPLLISLRHGADVLPGGRREALQQDWAHRGAD